MPQSGHRFLALEKIGKKRRRSPLADYDVIVIGAGVSGLYALHHLRDELQLSIRVYDGADDVGGTWWYNRYPGARVDGPGSPYYCYTFSDKLMEEWDWAETQPTQADVLAYVAHVAQHVDHICPRAAEGRLQGFLGVELRPLLIEISLPQVLADADVPGVRRQVAGQDARRRAERRALAR